MITVAYIIRYSQLYHDYASYPAANMTEIDSHLTKYTYIENPSRAEMQSQIDLCMFWLITPPVRLVRRIEYWIEQGVFFNCSPDVYYHVSEKYWPLIQCVVGADLKCCAVTDSDFTYSIELYKKAPWHFNLTVNKCNSVECLQTLRRMPNISRVANIECYKYLRKEGHYIDNITSYNSGEDMLQCLKYMRARRHSMPPHSMNAAALHGSIPCISYLRDMGVVWDNATNYAAAYGHLDCVEYILRHGGVLTGNEINSAAQGGYIKYIEHFHALGQSLDRTLEFAAAGGHIDCIKYLEKRGVPYGDALYNAARSGHYDCLVHLYENGSRDAKHVRNYHVYLGHLVTHDQLTHDSAMHGAAEGGHIECIEYLHSCGLPYGNALVIAASRSHLECVKYIYERTNCDLTGAMGCFARKGNIAGMEYLREQNVPWGNAYLYARDAQNWECMRYLQESGAVEPRDTMSIMQPSRIFNWS